MGEKQIQGISISGTIQAKKVTEFQDKYYHKIYLSVLGSESNVEVRMNNQEYNDFQLGQEVTLPLTYSKTTRDQASFSVYPHGKRCISDRH